MRRLTLIAAASLAVLCAPVQALDVQSFATNVDPCTDFFDFVNANWVAATELPPSRPRIGSFDQLRINNDKILTSALEELVAKPALQTTPGLKLAAAYYASGMNLDAIEAHGLAPLQPLLGKIAALDRREDLPALLAGISRLQFTAPLAAYVRPDAKDTRHYVLAIGQSGLGLPDRDDYFKADEVSKKLQDAYRSYARRLLDAAGLAPGDATIDELFAFETKLADATKPRAELRDPNANYNPMSPAELNKAAPGFDWQAYTDALTARPDGKHGVDRVIVGQPAFVKRVAQLAASVPLPVWRTYLAMRVLDGTANRLPKAFADAYFDYHDVAVAGLKAPPPRAEAVILSIGGRTGGEPMGLALGELFVARAFSPQAQARSTQLIADIKASMKHRIETAAWMSEPTRQKALEKLAAMLPKVGGPATYPTYPGLTLAPDDYAGNLLRTAAWDTARRMADLDKPVDRTRWTMSPYIVNATAGGLNEITFPAGILQPPFFDAKADDAVNYGGIGMVIGHEITHHFDDNGRNFDAVGSLTDWWTPADAAAYKQRADRVADLYSSYEPVPGFHINGRMTLGENISDMSGLPIAYDALQAALKRTGKTEKIDGYTPEQRFFLSNALVWRSKSRPESLINQVRTDPHSPAPFRVRGPMSNSPAFAKAFSCKAGSSMVAADPITVW